jgi:hypothetical protein
MRILLLLLPNRLLNSALSLALRLKAINPLAENIGVLFTLLTSPFAHEPPRPARAPVVERVLARVLCQLLIADDHQVASTFVGSQVRPT